MKKSLKKGDLVLVHIAGNSGRKTFRCAVTNIDKHQISVENPMGSCELTGLRQAGPGVALPTYELIDEKPKQEEEAEGQAASGKGTVAPKPGEPGEILNKKPKSS